MNPLEHPQWDDWINALSDATPFHSQGWARALVEAYGYKPFYGVLIQSDVMRSVLPMMEIRSFGGRRRGVSLPFSDLCGALAIDKSDVLMLVANMHSEACKRGWRTMEFRGTVPTGAPGIIPSSTYHTHIVDLSGTEEDQWNRCCPSTKRAVRKAMKSNLEIRCGCDDESMNVFYELFTVTRQRHGLPPPPLTFFKLLQRYLLQSGAGTIVTAQRSGQILAASMFLCSGSWGLYKYGASNLRYQADRPNNLVMWEGLRWCRMRGCRTLSLGKTRNVQEGLRRFKQGWGACEETMHYYTYDTTSKAYIICQDGVDAWYNKLFRNMPLPLLKWCGRQLYRHAA